MICIVRHGTWWRTLGSKWKGSLVRQGWGVCPDFCSKLRLQGCVTPPMGPLGLNGDAGWEPGSRSKTEQRWKKSSQLDDKCSRLQGSRLRHKVDPQNLETILERVKGRAVRSEAWKTLEVQREKYLLYPRAESSGIIHPFNSNMSQALFPGICSHVCVGFWQ